MALLGLLLLLLLPVDVLLQVANAAGGPGSILCGQCSVQAAAREPFFMAQEEYCKQAVRSTAGVQGLGGCSHSTMQHHVDACGVCCTDWLCLAWQLKEAQKE